jgi:hypothetical protein
VKKACVYALVLESSPEDYRYIGRTIETLHRRLSKHISETNVGNQTYVYRWIRKSIAQGETIKIVILEDNLTYKQSGIREIELIRHYKNIGYKLTNLTEGGDGGRLGQSGWKHTEEAKAKMRGNKHKLGKKDSLETREKKRLSSLGNKSNTGRKASEEARANMRAAQQRRNGNGWKHTEETKEKLRLANTGRKHTEEAKANMKRAQIGRKSSEEAKANMKRAQQLRIESGWKPSEEARAKMSLAQRRRWALTVEKSRITRANRTPEQIQQEHEKRGKAKKKDKPRTCPRGKCNPDCLERVGG